MKRVIILIVGLMLSFTAFTQKTVAVYVTPSADVPQSTTKILSSELVAAITRNADYIAIERADDFMAQLTEEQGRYNNIDDSKLFELGRKYGASNVCVAEITKFGDEYYIVARLLDIRTSRVWKTARKSSELKSLNELIEVSEALSNELIGNIKEFSTYAYGDNKYNQSYITKIENRENYTKVTFKFVSYLPEQKIAIKNTMYIEDLLTHIKYNFKDASNICIQDATMDNFTTIGQGIWIYSVFFDRISEDTKNIQIIEPEGYQYKDIILKPYADENTYVFEDKTQKVYDALIAKYEAEQRQLETQYSKMEYSTYAFGDNGENKNKILSDWFSYEQKSEGETGENRSYLIQIENNSSQTKVTFKFLSLNDKQKLGISNNTYIEDLDTHKKYKLISSSNVNILSYRASSNLSSDYKVIGKGVVEYSLFFERIPEQTRHIQIIEKYDYWGDKNGWEYKDIALKPYGKKDLYVFEDNTENEYQKLSKSFVYYIDFKNNHSDPRDIYIGGKYVGRVKGYGRKTFTVSTKIFGTLESIQTSGYLLNPNKEYFSIIKQKKGSTVNISN